jgi:NADH-quinone oxidoreductase subunit J
MNVLFYLASAVAIVATFLVITRTNAIHALLYLIVSLLAVALIFFLLGATFAAALEVIIYAGAIMVLFLFAVMVFQLQPSEENHLGVWTRPSIWVGPAIFVLILGAELLYALLHFNQQMVSNPGVPPQAVGVAMYGPYLLAVELASMLLLAGLVGAYHLGRQGENRGGRN